VSLTEQLRAATALLSAAGVPSARHDAEVLAGHVLGLRRSDVALAVLRGDELVLPLVFDDLVAERARRVPLQHLTGMAPFRDVELRVGPGVFVPRPETEVVAGAAIAFAQELTAPEVVDLCTGSGAIAVAVACEVPLARVHAVELSEHALAWAAMNVAELAPAVDLRLGDVAHAFGDLDGAVDVVVSNPPYIPPEQVPVDPEVRDHDPEVALYGLGVDGLQVPRLVLAAAARLLRAGGLLAMEHADVQQQALLRSLSSSGLWVDWAGHADLTGTPRYVTARRA
jgi:release factor glutamine methyltransferase